MSKKNARHRFDKRENELFLAEMSNSEQSNYRAMAPWRTEYTTNERICRDIENSVMGRLREKGLIR